MDKKEIMFAFVAEWRLSGLTRKEFSEQRKLQLPSFNYWCKKQYNEVEKPNKKQPTFIELDYSKKSIVDNFSEKTKSQPQIEFNLPSGVIIKIY